MSSIVYLLGIALSKKAFFRCLKNKNLVTSFRIWSVLEHCIPFKGPLNSELHCHKFIMHAENDIFQSVAKKNFVNFSMNARSKISLDIIYKNIDSKYTLSMVYIICWLSIRVSRYNKNLNLKYIWLRFFFCFHFI